MSSETTAWRARSVIAVELKMMLLLRRGNALFQEIERLCHRWIAQVSGPDLDSRAALVLLLTTMETALEESYPESDTQP